ncbi:peptidoglycan-binding domain-containing protein [Microbacterium oxydans]|uniref:Putative peptidoglycan binding domain protein n=1 Tax=Microbacterium oxydans TaxID=82380 RepID=A0A0F0LD81_9MICO|nr:peptidoglycan-binding domain-containing protein [Microbacterium oxydans]KJL30215.1 putative peptidoglycan binding domain protein [Microbacterium oxydans]
MTENKIPRGSRRSRWIIALTAFAVVVSIATGFWFAAQFQSTAQQEADAKAPDAAPIFADVIQGTLTGEASFTGDVGPSTQSPITVPPIADASFAVVTGHPLETGSTASSGQMLSEVNGRPLFGVQSAFSFYREMGLGDRGPDVKALQAALAGRGYSVAVDGRFGNETVRAVKQWYEDNGYEIATRNPSEINDDSVGDETETATPPEAYVPISEVVAIPTSSADVIRGLRVGQHLAVEGQPDFVLGSSDLVVTVTVPVTDLSDIAAGDAAEISVNGETVSGILGDILPTGEAPATNEAETDDAQLSEADEVTFTVIPQAALPASNGRARITVTTSVVAEDALIVPVLAVSDRGPDKNVLTKQQDDGTFLEVPVTVIGTLQGEVAVEPNEAGALKAGDRVRVG